MKQFRSSLKDTADDIHAKLMSAYPEAPEWWYVTLLIIRGLKNKHNTIIFILRYTILFVTAFVIAAIVCHFGHLMPWYFLFRNDSYDL